MNHSRRSLSTVLAGLMSLSALTAFVVGVPLLLLRVRPNPLPEKWPTFSRVMTMAKAGTIDSAVVPNVVAILVWACWAAMTLCVVAEVFGRLRGRAVEIPLLTPSFGGLSRRWVGSIAAMVALALPQGTAQAGTLASRLSNVPVVVSQTETVPSSPESLPTSSARPAVSSSDSRVESASVLSASPGRPSFSNSAALSTATSGRVVMVQAGDSYWELADSLTGDGFRWQELHAANVGRTMPGGYVIAEGDPMLHPGWELVVPDSWLTTQEAGWHERIVERGDTLSEIAAEEYGAPEQWRTIASDNPQVIDDPNLIFPGTPLLIRANATDPADPVHSPNQTPIVEHAEPEEVIRHVNDEPERAPLETTSDRPSGQIGGSPPASLASEADIPEPVVRGGTTSGTGGPLVGFLGITSAVAAAVLWRLNRRRKEDQVVRRVGAPSLMTSPLARKAEVSYRAIANDTQLSWLDAALLRAQLDAAAMGASIRMICAHEGWVEFRLNRSADPQSPFEQNGNGSWKLATTHAVSDLVVGNESLTSPLPFMLSVGDSNEGSVWICLDDLAVLNVESQQPDVATAVLASWAVQLLAVPWSQERSLVIVGAPPSVRHLAEGTHAACVADPSQIDPRSWLTDRVTVLSFLGDESVLAGLSDQQKKRITLVRASADDSDTGSDSCTVQVDSTTFSGSLQPGNIHLVAVSLTGPAQLDAVVFLIGMHTTYEVSNTHEIRTTHEVGPGSAEPSWDVPAQPVSTRAVSTHLGLGSTIDLTDGIREPSVTVPVPTFELRPPVAPSDTTDHTARAHEFITQVMAPKPVELSVLTECPTVVAGEATTSTRSVNELLLFLALCGPTPHDQLIGALYRTRRVDRGAVRQLVWRTRQLVGNVLIGEDATIALDRNGYGLDWDRFVRLSDFGHDSLRANDPSSALLSWEQAMNLVSGLPWQDANPQDRSGDGEWAIENGLLQHMTHRITDTAASLSRLALEHDRSELAPWAARRVLAVQSTPNVELLELGIQGALSIDDRTEARGLLELLSHAQDEFGTETSDFRRYGEALSDHAEAAR